MSDDKSIIEEVEEEREKERKIREEKQKLLDEVKQWEEDGWEVSNLKADIEEDLEEGKKLIEEYRKKIKRLKKINDVYHSLPVDKFDLHTTEFESNLNDPDAVEKLEKQISGIKNRINEIKKKKKNKKRERKERKKIMKKVKDWEEEGFKVDELKDTLKKDFQEGKKRFEEYKENIDELKLLRKKYYSLDTRGQNFDTIEIEHKLDDPTAVDELSEKIEKLGERRTQPEVQTTTVQQEVSYQKQEQTQQTPDIFTLDSIEDWLGIMENQRRNENIFQKIRHQLKDKEDLEEQLIDYLQNDTDLRENFLYYMEYWNKNLSEGEDRKYFKLLDEQTDHKVIKIYSNSPFIGCLYAIAALLKDEKVAISTSTRPHLFFKEYVDKLYGKKSDQLKEKEEDDKNIYYF